MLDILLQQYYLELVKLSPIITQQSEEKQAALLDFVYNLGTSRYRTSTLRKKVNAQDWNAAANELKKWVWGGGKKLPGLIKRRALEAALLTT